MTSYRTVKITINTKGEAHLAPSSALGGFAKEHPIVEVVEVPGDVTDDTVVRTYSRCVLVPVMHADRPVPWHKIAGAKEGQVIRLGPGRPYLDPSEKYVRITITLSPRALEILDQRGSGRSQEIERLITESAIPPAPR